MYSEDEDEADEKESLNLLPLQNMEVPVIFVIGGPGSGKATQCTKLAENFNLHHLSMGQAIKNTFKKGQTVRSNRLQSVVDSGGMLPLKETMYILEWTMLQMLQREVKPFLIHGFPRYLFQAISYERNIGFPRTVILLEADDTVLLGRLASRSATGGRIDDQPGAAIRKLEWHRSCINELISYYEPHHKLYVVDADRSVDAVYRDMTQVIELWI